ncbi:MAG: transaldolase family protein [Propionibacteriaceae bacterium]|nr:transaldolase family protein [Propionibacteriaceae bacterium]
MSYKSPLHQMSQTTPTQFWNDNCSLDDLTFAIEHGAVGATTNPVIVGQVLAAELDSYIPLIRELINRNPAATEDDIAWLLNEQMAQDGAELLRPVFVASDGKAGYISIQTNAKYNRDAKLMVDQAVHFAGLADNIMVKLPVTAAGVKAVEESTYRGVNVNATVSFTVAQALAVAEAVERGLARREQEGLDNSKMHPVCTIMVGRVEDFLRDVMNTAGIIVDPNAIDMSGVAVFKRAYAIYQENSYRTRLLAAAIRNHYHWSEFIGGEVSVTIPPVWIRRFVNSDITVVNRMNNPVDQSLLTQLAKHFPAWKQAYEPNGMQPQEFAFFGATKATLNQFLDGYDKMVSIIRPFMING